jgi:hypothetical protein
MGKNRAKPTPETRKTAAERAMKQQVVTDRKFEQKWMEDNEEALLDRERAG